MTADVNLKDWATRELARKKEQLEKLETGKMTIGESSFGGPIIDTTAEQVAIVKSEISQLEYVLEH
jgi:hypothetical protein